MPPLSFVQLYAPSPFPTLVPPPPTFLSQPLALTFSYPAHLRSISAPPCPVVRPLPCPYDPGNSTWKNAVSKQIYWCIVGFPADAGPGGARPPSTFLCMKPPESSLLPISDWYCNVQFRVHRNAEFWHVGAKMGGNDPIAVPKPIYGCSSDAINVFSPVITGIFCSTRDGDMVPLLCTNRTVVIDAGRLRAEFQEYDDWCWTDLSSGRDNSWRTLRHLQHTADETHHWLSLHQVIHN